MRKLRIVIGRSPKVAPVIAAVGLMPVLASCGSRSGLLSVDDAGVSTGGNAGSGGAGGTALGGFGGTGGAGGVIVTGGTGGFGGVGGTGGTGGAPWCPPYRQIETHVVDIPPPGVPASPGQLCAVSVEPVTSNTAARVTLTKYSPALELAQGFVAIAPDVQKVLAGPPKISVKTANPPQLGKMQVSALTQLAGGYSFHATFDGPLSLEPNGWVMLEVEVELDIACDPSGTDIRTVTSRTEIHLCMGDADLEWVSSGDECTVCKIIAEMAPPPMLPDPVPDGLPMPRAFRLRVVELARVADSVLLFAENDAGAEARYDWQVSAGRLEHIAPDLVLWTTASSGLLQVAVEHADGAAVASFDWEAP
jgi:hypothetical protein